MLPVSSCSCTNLPHAALSPTLTIFPSFTAITGEFCFAKIETSLLFGSDPTGIAALPDLTRFLANAVTELSAYFEGAATGK